MDDPAWLVHVRAMVERASANQGELFYRIALAGWEAELAKITATNQRELAPANTGGLQSRDGSTPSIATRPHTEAKHFS